MIAKVERGHRNRQDQLSELAVSLSRLSPASALTFASMSLANTGIDRQDQFVEAVRKYRTAFDEYISEKHQVSGGQAVVRMGEGLPRIMGVPGQEPVDISDLPAFIYHREPLSQSLGRAAIDILMMALLTLLLFAGGVILLLEVRRSVAGPLQEPRK